MFRCPVCLDPLSLASDEGAAGAWRCARGHSFDVAREGYVNLLITHQRRRREPGDSAEMLRHRRDFLARGHYGPLAQALADFAAPGQSVLDAGCGEGYYTAAWPGDRDGLELWGVDIAKPAVRMAAGRARHQARCHYAVGSVYDLPVVDASIDLVVSVFAPIHSAEFERVMRPGGRLVTVTPGPDHLAGLKARLFSEVERHPERGPLEGEAAATRMVPLSTTRLRYDLEVDDLRTSSDLLNMTPYAWYVSADVRAEAASQLPLATPVDFLVSAYVMPP